VPIDGTSFPDRIIVAQGINVEGRKTALGLREGATESAEVWQQGAGGGNPSQSTALGKAEVPLISCSIDTEVCE
jgi:hypothetical protein